VQAVQKISCISHEMHNSSDNTDFTAVLNLVRTAIVIDYKLPNVITLPDIYLGRGLGRKFKQP